MSKDFNLEDEFGWILDGVENYIEENPDDFLEHYGIPGMKWGKRKSNPKSDRPELKPLGPSKIVRKTKYGEEMTLSNDPPTALHKTLARISPKYREHYERGAFLTIRDSTGKKVGDATVLKKNDEELNLIWLGIDKSARGKGYASAVMQSAADFGRETGLKKLTLEVPGNSPDARHIYEKLGFKDTGETHGTAKNDPMWGGLTSMEYVFDTVKHSEEVYMSAEVEAFLAHHGVPGMKWGKRKAQSNSGGSSGRSSGGTETLKPKMSRNKKIAIAVGVGATIAIGAAVTIAVLNNNSKMTLPVQSLTTHKSAIRGKANLIFGAAAQSAHDAKSAAPMTTTRSSLKGKSNLIFGAAAQQAREAKPNPVVVKQLSERATRQARASIAKAEASGKAPLSAKVKETIINKAKDMAYERAKEQAMDKVKEMAINKAKSMLRPASSIPAQPAVRFNPKTGLYEEVPADSQAA